MAELPKGVSGPRGEPPRSGRPMSAELELVGALLLALLNGFFVAAEFALVKVRATRIEELANAGHRAARLVQRQIRSLDVYLAASRIA